MTTGLYDLLLFSYGIAVETDLFQPGAVELRRVTVQSAEEEVAKESHQDRQKAQDK
jgi:hypothetical protein